MFFMSRLFLANCGKNDLQISFLGKGFSQAFSAVLVVLVVVIVLLLVDTGQVFRLGLKKGKAGLLKISVLVFNIH